jgi:tetratricopeptide (TPR) repeat protein
VSSSLMQRIESYYKNDLIFKYEDMFIVENEELGIDAPTENDDLSLDIPRYVHHVSEKQFRSTVDMFEYCAQFAVTGSIRAWFIVEGEIKHFATIEPKGDKAAILLFSKGRNLVKQKGKEKEAIEALSLAIEKYDRHAQAYERRAKVNFMMKNYHDALRDYNKCIGIDPSIPTSYYGKAKIHIIKEEWNEAIECLEDSIKKSIALQTLHWKSRRLKGYCHIMLKEWSKAAFDLKLFVNRQFTDDNPNKTWQRWAHYNYGIVQIELGEYLDAIKIMDKALNLVPVIPDGIVEADILVERGVAKQKGGKSGGIKDIKDAASKGNVKAKNLLRDIVK